MDNLKSAHLVYRHALDRTRDLAVNAGKYLSSGDGWILAHVQPYCQQTRNSLVDVLGPVFNGLAEVSYSLQVHPRSPEVWSAMLLGAFHSPYLPILSLGDNSLKHSS